MGAFLFHPNPQDPLIVAGNMLSFFCCLLPLFHADSLKELIEDMTITKARITAMPKDFGDPMPKVMVVLEGETEEQELFEYYPDEISFKSDEFIGLTLGEARSLKGKKDRDYLRS